MSPLTNPTVGSPLPALAVPPPLRAGDRVVLAAASGMPQRDRVPAGADLLRGWGLEVEFAEHWSDAHPVFDYLAGTDADRASDLQAAWCDPTVAGVIMLCGGYGAHRMVDLLDWDAMAAATPKVFAGFSDVTVLHEALALHLGVATLYGPMAASDAFVNDAAGREGLRVALFEPPAGRVLSWPAAEALTPRTAGVARGVTVGGCVSLLSSSLASDTGRRNVAGGILLLEDIEEEPYRLDRILTQLLRAGYFDGVAGIALGSWVACGPPSVVRDLMIDRLAPLGVPIVWNLNFGHCDQPLTVPLGVPATLDSAAGTLTIGW
jgi:muramoyltetrapeptide carboxypeptidase